jgi:hypothetical protein
LVPKSDPEDRSCAVGLEFSVVTLFAHRPMTKSAQAVRRTAWYRKSYPTFSDALALVRKELWAQDEMGTNTSLASLYAWSPKGDRRALRCRETGARTSRWFRA